MKSLSPGLQVEGLQVQALVRSHDQGFIYLVVDPTLGRSFELEEYAPETLIQREDDAQLNPLPGQEPEFAAGLKRFLAAARLQSQLEHPTLPHVIRVIEANGTAYQLRPAREGKSLAELMASGNSAREIKPAELLKQLAGGLQRLHDQGVAHGCLSPQEIFISADDIPFLADLGAASGRAIDAHEASLPYLAPEVRSGNEPTAQSDCYGLAATLWALEKGKAPPDSEQRAEAEREGQGDPLDLSDLRQAGALGDGLARALELKPGKRPESMSSWAESVSGIDSRLRMIQEDTDSPDPTERRPWGPIALAAIVTLLMISAGVFLISNRELPLDQWFQEVDLDGERDRGPRVSAPDSEEQQRWEAALDADTLLGYRNFLRDFPVSIFSEQAQIQIDILDERAWSTLSEENTRSAYVDYLDDFPTGLHQAEALRRIEVMDEEAARQERERVERERQDNAAWAEARNVRTIDSMGKYITDWPAGLHIDEALRIRRQLRDQANDSRAFATAQDLDTEEAFQAYVDAFPQGQFITEALQALDRLDLTPGKPFRDCPTCPEMRVMPVGVFPQGAAPNDPLALAQERPQRVVNISEPFAVSIYEITFGQWDACLEAGACSTRPPDNGWGRGDRPVIMVSWNDAQEFVAWLSELTGQIYRLPTESEWEYFARADGRGPWLGDDPAGICQFGNIAGAETGFEWQHEACEDPVAVGTVPVGAFRPNRAGLFDVIGNVAEWTADCLNLSYLDAPTDGSAWTRGICSSHMTRGGSWVTGSRDIRLSSRFNLKNGDRNDFTGFRVVRVIED